MKRTKLLLCILAILATMIIAGCSLAEGTPELSFEIPESVVFGMPIPISGISTSSNEGSIRVVIGEYSATTIYPEDGAWPESVTLSSDSMFRYYTKSAGRYDVSLEWEKTDGTTVTVKKYILLTEGEPATSAPTICSTNSSGVNTSEFYFGDSVTLHGKSGGATKLYLYGSPTNGGQIYEVILPDADGNWTYTMESTDRSSRIRFEVRGYIGDEGEGRFTGFSENCYCYFFDPENEPDIASVTVTSVDYTTANLEIANPDHEKYDIFSWAVLNPDGVVLKTGGEQMYNYGTIYSTYVHLDFRGEYILETLLHNYSGDYTKPVRTTVTVTDGRPYPTNGPQRIDVTVPDTWEARKNIPIICVPTLPDQKLSFSLSWQPPETSYYTGTDVRIQEEDGGWTILGYELQPGRYRLDVKATADTYQDTEQRFLFTVTDNPEIPAAPVLSEIKGQIWPQFDMEFVLTEPWNTAYTELRYPDGGRTSEQEIKNSDRFRMKVYSEGTYDLYASGERNGTWSEMVKIGEVEVTAIPAVSQIAAYPPETLHFGAEYSIPVLVPESGYYLQWRLLAADGKAINISSDWVSDPFTHLYIGDTLLNNYLDAPGSYELEIEYNGQTVRYPVNITGEKPVPLTAETESPLASVGDTIRIAGTAGSADRIALYAHAYGGSTYHFLDEKINPVVASDGTWEYTVTASEPGRYTFEIRGYTEDGYLTGKADISVLVPDGDSSLGLHLEAGTDPDNGKLIQMSFSADGMNNTTEWEFFITGPDGKIHTTGNVYGYESDNGAATTNIYTRYRGTYTISAYVKEEGTWAVFAGPVTQTVTVTEGRPWPVNGPAPTGLTIPETWPAGVELSFEWAPVVETQEIELQVYHENSNLYGFSADDPSVFEIGSLEEGTYWFRITTEADTYEYTVADYTMRVVENPNRPAAPVLTLPEQTIYPRAAFTVQLDQAYEEAEGYLAVNGSGGYSCNITLQGDQARIQNYWLPDYQEFTLFMKVKQNGAWSRYASLQIATEVVPEVEEITFLGVPESVRFGEAFEVGIIFPDDSEGFNRPFYYTITDPATGNERASSSGWLNDTSYYSFSFSEYDLMNWLYGPGTYDVSIECGSHTATFQLQVVGGKPECPTILTESGFTEIGDTIRITGTAGDADVLDVYYDVNGRRVNLGHPELTAEGVWSYEIPATAYGTYYVEASGHTAEGLYTGSAGTTIVVPDESSTAVPQISLTIDPDDGQRVEIELTAPGDWNYAQWWYSVTGPDGKDLWINSTRAYDGGSYRSSFYTSYQGTYTLTACYRAEYPSGSDVLSRTASESFTITEGRPWPVNGPAPTGLDEIPTTIQAGEELVLNWTPVNNTHSIVLQIYRNGTSVDGAGRDNSAGTFRFVFEEAGDYEIRVWSYADTYENFSTTYSLTVTANPDQPDPPELTLTDEHVYCQVPFTVQLDDVYEDAKCIITVETPDNRSYGPADCTLNGNLLRTRTGGGTHILEAGKFTLSVSVKKNGLWSQKASIEITLTDLPEVTDITMMSMPQTLQRGDDLQFTILLPGPAGRVELAILDAGKQRTTWSDPWFDGNIISYSFEGHITANSYMVNGLYYLRLIWNGQVKDWPFTLTGDSMELQTIDAVPVGAQAGGSVTLTGRTGDADRIQVVASSRTDWMQRDAAVNEDGTWSCELRNLQTGKYNLNVYGWKGTRSIGAIYTALMVSDEASLAKPTVTSDTRNGSITISLTPGQDMSGNMVRWHIQWNDAHGQTGNISELYSNGNDTYLYRLYSQYVNTYTITAAYETDGVYSVPEQITVSVSGKDWPINGKTPLNVEIPATWEAGRDLQIAWAPEVQRQWFSINIRNSETGRNIYSEYTESAKTFTVDGYLLESGAYTLNIGTEADTYEQVNKRYSLTVTDNAGRPAAPGVSVEPEVLTDSSVIHLKLNRSYDKVSAVITTGGSIIYEGVQTDTDDYRCGPYGEGEWEAKVYVHENSVWSLPGTATLNIQANPPLNTPAFDPSTPDTIAISNPLPLKITDIDSRAKRINIEVMRFYESDSWDYFYDYQDVLNNTGTYTGKIPENVFETAGNYSLIIEIEGTGYHSVTISKTITVTGERPEAPTVSLSATSATVGDTVYATVVANGATQAEYARDEMPGNFDPSMGIYGMKNGRVRIPITVTGGDYYHFRVFVNGKWSKWTDTVWIDSDEPDPEDSSLFHVTFPESVTAGEDAAVIIEPMDGMDVYGIEINCWTGENDEPHDRYFYSMQNVRTGSVMIPGIYFKADYRVHIEVHAGAGRNEYRVWKTKTLEVSAGTAGNQLAISTDQTRYAYGAPVTISLGGVQAEKLLIRTCSNTVHEGENAWFIRDEITAAPGASLTSVTMTYWNPGENRLQAAALVNGAWTDWSETLIIWVDEPTSTLEMVQSSVEMIGGAAHVTWDPVEHAETYTIRWYSVNGSSSHSAEVQGVTSYDITDGISQPGYYQIYVVARANGYQNAANAIYWLVYIGDESPIGNILYLPAALTEIEEEAFAGINTEKIVIPASCSTVSANAFAGCSQLREAEVQGMNTVVNSAAFSGCGTVVVYVLPGSAAEASLAGSPNAELRYPEN